MDQVIVISSPQRVPSEIAKVVSLFKAGLQQFHIRKPDFNDFDMISYLTSIPQEYHRFIVLHSHYYLVKEFNLKGIQVGKTRIEEGRQFKGSCSYYGYSAHSFNEVVALKGEYTHFFLSPVFDSVSKSDYKSEFNTADIHEFLQNNSDLQLVALGGITKSNKQEALSIGFKGVAVLGAIWQEQDYLESFTALLADNSERPYILTIAGFDPSCGAGVSADIKTFELNKTQGLAVTTSITYQNESEFIGLDWLDYEQIKKQINVLFQKHKPQFVKIGLIKDLDVLKKIIAELKNMNPKIKIIWDPVLSASSGFEFHAAINKEKLNSILKLMYLVTPNIPECEKLWGTSNPNKLQGQLKEFGECAILLKGGHSDTNKVTDILIENNTITNFDGQRIENNTKHGTGCILSSAITAGLAIGMSLSESVLKAKEYTRGVIQSNSGLLGYHYNENK